jgi:hypothetical protein
LEAGFPQGGEQYGPREDAESNVANSAKMLARMLVLRSETKNGRMLK